MNLMLVLVICSSFLFASSNSILSFEELVNKHYPGCEYKKESLFLSSQQVKATKKLSKVPGQSSLGLRFHLTCKTEKKTKTEKYIYFDSHIVRTLNETVMTTIIEKKDHVVIDDSKIIFFQEPAEYKPNKLWINQFQGKKLNDKLKVYGDIDGLTGSTLSVKAISHSARRILALHHILKK